MAYETSVNHEMCGHLTLILYNYLCTNWTRIVITCWNTEMGSFFFLTEQVCTYTKLLHVTLSPCIERIYKHICIVAQQKWHMHTFVFSSVIIHYAIILTYMNLGMWLITMDNSSNLQMDKIKPLLCFRKHLVETCSSLFNV